MLAFEIKRYIAKKHLLFTIIVVFLIFLIDFAFELATGEFYGNAGLKLNNLSQAVYQFSIIALLPIMTDTFTNDYSNNNIVFFLQNRISGKKMFISKVVVYNFFTLFIYMVFFFLFLFFGNYFNIGIKNIWLVILFNLLIVIASVNLSLLFTLIFKKKWSSFISIFFMWFLANIINALEIPFISKNFLPVDGNSHVALLIKSISNGVLDNSLFMVSIVACIIWAILPVFLGVLMADFWIRSNIL